MGISFSLKGDFIKKDEVFCTAKGGGALSLCAS